MYDHVEGCFHVKTRHSVASSNRKPHTYPVNLQTRSCTCNKTLLLGFPCSHILTTCHYRAIDFQQFVQGYYTTCAYLSTWAPLFYLIFDELGWPQYNGPIIVPSDSMKRLTSGRLKSSRVHNEMDARETRTPKTCVGVHNFASNRVTIDVLVLIKKPMIGRVDVLHEHLIVLLFSYILVLTLIILKYM